MNLKELERLRQVHLDAVAADYDRRIFLPAVRALQSTCKHEFVTRGAVLRCTRCKLAQFSP